MKRSNILNVFILIILPFIYVQAQPGFPDPSFKSGMLFQQMKKIDFKAYDVEIQEDGKYLITGKLEQEGEQDVLVIRLYPDGTPDPGFGKMGIATFDLTKSTVEYGKTVKIRMGKILIAGTTDAQGFIMRLNEDGSLDSSFAELGYCVTSKLNSVHDMSTFDFGEGYKILLAGSYKDGLKSNPGLLCFSSTGHFCPNYGEMGRAQLPDDIQGCFSKISVARNGNLYAIGTVQCSGELNQDALVAKFNYNGTLNSCFNNDKGFVIVEGPVKDHRNNAVDLYVDREGYITVCGDFDNGKNDDAYIFRLTRKGVMDHEFGCKKNGYFRSAFLGENDEISSMVIQPNGRIIIGGRSDFKGDFDFNLVRLHCNGLADNSFGHQSWQMMDFSSGQDGIQAMDIHGEGSIIVVGTSKYNTGEKIVVSKLRIDQAGSKHDIEKELAICRIQSARIP